MRDLSVIIPARNEEFLPNTIDDILRNREVDTEVIAILDDYWPDPPILDHPDVTIVHHTGSIGQRAAVNEGARISQAEHIMKADAHCAFGKGFDRILIEDCRYEWTMIPMMYNLHVFDWKCNHCGNQTYQGLRPKNCKKCGHAQFERIMLWQPREGKGPYVSWRFDNNVVFKQWRKHCRRPEAQGDFVETMSFAGPCFFIHKKRYWELGGCDEKHGSWGQFGTEWACKTWLSGGKLITTRKTWFAHLFRTGNFKGTGYKGSSFPYHLSGKQQEYAKKYSQDLWLNNKWPKAKYPLSWLVEKFKPVPDWHDNT
jgi:glycosyltransferase involved in cell wall biosynthesis